MVRTLDPAKVAIIVGGIPISGFADGTFVKIERTSDMYTMKTGADGHTGRVKSNDRSASMTFTLMQFSPANAALSGFAIADELHNAGVVPILVSDLSGTSTFFSGTGWVRKIPSWEAGKDVATVEWVIDCADVDIFIGGNSVEAGSVEP